MNQENDFSENAKEVKQQYLEVFDPRLYHRIYYSSLDDEVKFFLRRYHEVFTKDPLLSARCRSRRRVLEFGCGPVPVYAASAAFFTESITMSEIIPTNRSEIEFWMNSRPEALDWTPFFSYLASLGDGRKENEIADRLREVFQVVIPCDGTLEEPLAPIHQKYDVIMTTLCLEFATTTKADHRAMLGRVANLLRPGGVLLMAGALGNTSYSVGSTRYPSVSLQKEDLEDAVTSAALRVASLVTLERQTSSDEKPADHHGVFFLVAENQEEPTV
ncbi:indolethylamine N-methyltransferase-like [Penaeus japonicus]|uniref:indolethylamine N-methyltransferase-like n=1 Tax=Penaeus japonicus TaxID=27405 RepID=UPI001C7131A3|nr:indolethylamine N-methyltransferase-like [Penaeus japonicus]